MNQRTTKVAGAGGSTTQNEELPFSVELWDRNGRSLQRVLARAFNSVLARAIFKAAQKEHPERRILLRKGARTIADSAE
jgi:hypothetical protein